MRIIRAIISAITDTATKLKRFSGSAGVESFSDWPMYQHYGFASRPKSGADGVAIASGGGFLMIADGDRRYRIPLQEGEVSIFTDEGDKIHFKRGNEIAIESGAKVSVNAPAIEVTGTVTITGDVTVTGNIEATGNIIDGGANTNHHNHP